MKAVPGRSCAIVMGLDVSGYGIVRSLGRHDIPVVGLWRKPNECGRFSRYATAIKVEPDDDATWVQTLTDLARRYDQPVLFPSNDRSADLLARHQGELAARARFHWVPLDTLGTVVDKARIAELARSIGLPVPRTHRPRGEGKGEGGVEVGGVGGDLQADADAFVYPCLVKPITTFRAPLPGGLKAIMCASAGELVELYRRMPDLLGTTLWQEIVEGEDDAIYQGTALAVKPGDVAAMACVRKIRQYVPGFGITSFGRTEWQETVVEQTTRLVQALSWSGVASVEFKRSARDGRFFLIEMNPRVPWYNILFADSGLNLPLLVWRTLTGGKLPVARQVEGVAWISLASDLASFWQRRAAGKLGTAAWLGSLAEARSFSWYDTFDPVPAMATAVRQWGMGVHLVRREFEP